MKQKKQLGILIGLLLVAAFVWRVELEKPEASTGAVNSANNLQLLSVENPQLHTDRIEAARKTEYKGTGRNIFSAIAPPPVSPAATSKVAEKAVAQRKFVGPMPEVPPPPPPPPTLPANLKFFGYGTVPNGSSRRAFFTDGEDVYVVAEGEILLNRFRILKVGNDKLEFEEINSGRHGTAMLEEQAASPAG